VLNTLKNLKTFRAEQKLQQTIWMFLATYFAAKDEKQKMIEIFDKIDINKDGILSQEELKQGNYLEKRVMVRDGVAYRKDHVNERCSRYYQESGS
jgi:hypothetical protein